ncbi:hypothetical protein [Frondihabitans australicus]|uniref:Glycosyltransferase involved in cell wall biosynthesis n=1 Tax=Frondihabitans australicus TaxID=386892 RepID=A0A495IFV1_9MICO|nr:hypothetical protein [Frondihabitans australicus]RKR74814.1 hypothetical protein C8E83_1945 [Frondihabitans australicus]
MSATAPTQIIVGPEGNGVVDYAMDLAEAIRRRRPSTVIVRHAVVAGTASVARSHPRAHLHVTDALFGESLEAAGDALAEVVSAAPTSVTLHDVPQESDGERNLVRRGDVYRRIASLAVGVAVSSRHEADLVRRHLCPGLEPRVVPLGTRRPSTPGEASESASEAIRRTAPGRPVETIRILVAGYVYPGKGHDDVVRAAAVVSSRLGRPVTVTALGGAARGHAHEVESLNELATSNGVSFEVTGFLSGDDYRALCRADGVPVVAHRHYSASRSLLDWGEQGRRAVVVDNAYAHEMAALRPGTLDVVAPGLETLADAIEARVQEPATTYLAAGHPLSPTLDDAAGAYLAWWDGLAW